MNESQGRGADPMGSHDQHTENRFQHSPGVAMSPEERSSSGAERPSQSEQAVQEFKNAASGMGETITRNAQIRARDLKQGFNRLMDQQKSAATSRLTTWAESAREASGRVTEEHPQVAGMLDQAASKVDAAASYLRNRDFSEIVSGINQFGRQHPVLLLGGMFVAGALAARFIKASQMRRGGTTNQDDGEFGEADGEPPFLNRNPTGTPASSKPVLSEAGTSPVQQSAGSNLRGGLERGDL